MLNITRNPIKDINVNLSFPSSRWKVVEWTPPQDWKNVLNSFLSSVWKVVEWNPQIWHLGEILEILLFQVQSIECMQICHKHLLPISWGPFEDVNLLYFLLKMQIWNGCNVLNITRNPINRYQCKSFISKFKMKSCGMDPPRIGKFLNSFLSSVSKVVEWNPQSDIWGKFWKFYFSRYSPLSACKFAITPFSHQLRAIWRC